MTQQTTHDYDKHKDAIQAAHDERRLPRNPAGGLVWTGAGKGGPHGLVALPCTQEAGNYWVDKDGGMLWHVVINDRNEPESQLLQEASDRTTPTTHDPFTNVRGEASRRALVREVLARASNNYGFITDEDLAVLATSEETRLRTVLVRWHEGRFSCPAQDAKVLIDALRAQDWTLRDVSLTS